MDGEDPGGLAPDRGEWDGTRARDTVRGEREGCLPCGPGRRGWVVSRWAHASLAPTVQVVYVWAFFFFFWPWAKLRIEAHFGGHQLDTYGRSRVPARSLKFTFLPVGSLFYRGNPDPFV